jgi:hypothetical protein
MQTITKEYQVYKFSELSDSAKEKAIQDLYDINIDYAWHEFSYEHFIEQLNEVGLDCEKFYFSLDRDYYIEPVKLRFTDVEKFIKAKVDEKVKKSLIEIADLYLTTACFSRHNKPVVESYAHTLIKHQRLNKAIDSLVERADEAIHSMLNDFLSQLQKEYDYLTSEEAIIETIEANDYDFSENGKLF